MKSTPTTYFETHIFVTWESKNGEKVEYFSDLKKAEKKFDKMEAKGYYTTIEIIVDLVENGKNYRD